VYCICSGSMSWLCPWPRPTASPPSVPRPCGLRGGPAHSCREGGVRGDRDQGHLRQRAGPPPGARVRVWEIRCAAVPGLCMQGPCCAHAHKLTRIKTHAHTCTHIHTHAHTCTHMHTNSRVLACPPPFLVCFDPWFVR